MVAERESAVFQERIKNGGGGERENKKRRGRSFLLALGLGGGVCRVCFAGSRDWARSEMSGWIPEVSNLMSESSARMWNIYAVYFIIPLPTPRFSVKNEPKFPILHRVRKEKIKLK